MAQATPQHILAALWQQAGLAPAALPAVTLTGAEPALPSSFRVGAAAQATIAASGAAAAAIWQARTGRAQGVAVDMRHAAVEFHSEHYLKLAGKEPGDPWDNIAGTYVCGDGRVVRLHTNFPHHRAGIIMLLNCAGERPAVQAALDKWQAFDFEEAAAAAGMCVTAMRSFAEWDDHPQGQAVQSLAPVELIKIGEAPPTPLPSGGARPLAGLRALELTRVIAGPVCGRTLAAHGAEVLHISAAHLPAFDHLNVDVNRGKRSAQLDLRTPEGQQKLRELALGADIFIQGYRPGAVASHGFTPAQLAAL